ncbi:MAG: hypothetical protein NVS4B3_14190 [Gemmatimonadaceae bacterium]
MSRGGSGCRGNGTLLGSPPGRCDPVTGCGKGARLRLAKELLRGLDKCVVSREARAREKTGNSRP